MTEDHLPPYRRTKAELYEMLGEAQRALDELESLLQDEFDVDTILKFEQGDSIWLALKVGVRDDSGNILWYDYANQRCVPWERLFPVDIRGLNIYVLHSDRVWTGPKYETADESEYPLDEVDSLLPIVPIIPADSGSSAIGTAKVTTGELI